jgi:hypothetical protein
MSSCSVPVGGSRHLALLASQESTISSSNRNKNALERDSDTEWALQLDCSIPHTLPMMCFLELTLAHNEIVITLDV